MAACSVSQVKTKAGKRWGTDSLPDCAIPTLGDDAFASNTHAELPWWKLQHVRKCIWVTFFAPSLQITEKLTSRKVRTAPIEHGHFSGETDSLSSHFDDEGEKAQESAACPSSLASGILCICIPQK